MRSLRLPLCAALTAGALVTLGMPAPAAETYPSRVIKIIVSTSAGGITDIGARILGNYISTKTGQPVVIDNRPGGSGNIGVEAVTRATPDGYTLGFTNTGNIVINPYLYSHLNFDPLNDLVPVGSVGTVPLFLVTNANAPFKTLQEFVAYAKAHPDKVNYGGAGAGTTPDLAADAFARRAGLKFVVVPFKGTTPATTAVISGEVDVTFVSMGQHIQFVRNGTLRVLGAATPKRVAYLPDVPTFAEQGFPGFEASTWFALFAPRGTPKEIVDQLNGYIRGVQQDAGESQRLTNALVDPLPLNADEFAALVKADAKRWEQIVRESGIKLD
jgi:tripartite-type tricarboxylate transporter receptor subunit TctC